MAALEQPLIERILAGTQGTAITHVEVIQSLWSGYGELLKCKIEGSKHSSVIVKHIQLPKVANHPRGWNTNKSHERKRRSYEVEMRWYDGLARNAHDGCRVPKVLGSWQEEGEMGILMEDLDAAGFPVRKRRVTMDEINACLSWLANFHATYMQQKPEGLWEIGSYWHLDTRPDEWEAMQDQELKKVAAAIDATLNAARYQTIIHGDAKLANFCFSAADGHEVAAVDFQYVGGGCGMKDVAYFLSSCLSEAECEKHEAQLLKHYFDALEVALDKRSLSIEFQSLMDEWMRLYPYAWADFYRFLDGWSPGHWKMHRYSEGMKQKVLAELQQA